MAMAGPRFFGFVIGGSLPVTLAANWLARRLGSELGALQRDAVDRAHSKQMALRWLLDLLGLAAANAAARSSPARPWRISPRWPRRATRCWRASGWNVEADGLFGAPPIPVVVGEEVHPTLVKSLGLLGLGRNRVVRVPVDGQGRMRADALPRIAAPTIVCAAGRQREHRRVRSDRRDLRPRAGSGAWVHVDGAFGLWAAAAPPLAALVRGVERRRFVGDRCAQVAERALRLRPRVRRAMPRRCAPRWR